MDSDLEQLIRSIPREAFQDPHSGFAELSPIERLRWLQQTAWFVWKYKGAARRDDPAPPAEGTG